MQLRIYCFIKCTVCAHTLHMLTTVITNYHYSNSVVWKCAGNGRTSAIGIDSYEARVMPCFYYPPFFFFLFFFCSIHNLSFPLNIIVSIVVWGSTVFLLIYFFFFLCLQIFNCFTLLPSFFSLNSRGATTAKKKPKNVSNGEKNRFRVPPYRSYSFAWWHMLLAFPSRKHIAITAFICLIAQLTLSFTKIPHKWKKKSFACSPFVWWIAHPMVVAAFIFFLLSFQINISTEHECQTIRVCPCLASDSAVNKLICKEWTMRMNCWCNYLYKLHDIAIQAWSSCAYGYAILIRFAFDVQSRFPPDYRTRSETILLPFCFCAHCPRTFECVK